MLTITRKGYITLWRDGVRISQHTVAEEAYERAVSHAQVHGAGKYTVKYPDRELDVGFFIIRSSAAAPGGGGGGSTYAGFTPTIYAAPTDQGTGDGSSEANAMDLATALTTVTAGGIVGCIPGTYSIARGAQNNTPAWHTTNSGTSGSPIRIVAKYQATSLATVASNADRCELVHTGASSYNGANSGPLYGCNGRDHVHWYGFYCDETDFYTKSDNGPVYFANTTGGRVYNAVIDMNAAALWSPSDNHNCIRIGEGTSAATDVVVSNCRMITAFSNFDDDSNAAAIMLYGARNFTIEKCEIANCTSLIYIKGGGTAGDNYGHVQYNYLHDGDYIRCQFTDAASQVFIHHNVFESVANAALLLNQSCDNVEFYSNTIVMDAAIVNGAWFVNGGAASETGLEVRKNIFYATADNRYMIQAGNLTVAFGSITDNLYYNTSGNYDWSYNGSNYTVFATWATAVGETGSAVGDPGFLLTGTGPELYKRSSYSDGRGAYEVGTELIGVQA